MRIRTAKKLAQRIDLNYFKRAHGQRRWRFLLSAALPAAALVWIAGYAAAGNRAPYSAGPVSSAHAFAEQKCEVCHARDAGFRAHVSQGACLGCHDAPAHAVKQPAPPDCATCHQEHSGRVRLAHVADTLCVGCHRDPQSTGPAAPIGVREFPDGHPEFAAIRTHQKDPGGLRFNHAVHVKAEGVRGPKGAERLECAACHKPEIVRQIGRRTLGTGLMTTASFADACARCHPLYFDESVDARAPHDRPAVVREFVQKALTDYIAEHPEDIGRSTGVRRVPINFPRAPEPPARNAADWITRRLAADERLLWNKTCSECHERSATGSTDRTAGASGLPAYVPSNVTRLWMTRASFDHTPHGAVQCSGCHRAETSESASDVLMPPASACATCHTPGRGAEARCFECHQYHDWSKSHPVAPPFRVDSFK